MTSSLSTPGAAPLGPAARQGNTAFATSVALLLVRLALGWTFIYHGYQLVFVFGAEKFAENLHLPVLPEIVWAYMAVWGQLLGGIGVCVGALARLWALPLIVNMLVAIATVHEPYGFALPKGYEYNVNLIAECLVVLIAGPGLISVDAFLFRRGLWARGAQPLDQPIRRT
ncbi:MAG TPA: DoxX family protein [Phycisphaerae bacterium]|nr:DoxX family protein [Phycisphaerae bacterium]